MNDTVAGSIWAMLGLALLAFSGLFWLEAFTYWTHQPPITTYVRNWTWGHLFVAALIGVALVAGAAMALTHFILDGER